jgi:hypothetical protein
LTQLPFVLTTLIYLHSLVRWLVLATLIYTLYRAYRGYFYNSVFSKADKAWRHWTATTAHIQLMLGIVLYSKSVTVKAFFGGLGSTKHVTEPLFFGVIHITAMLSAVVLVTIGSAIAKRKTIDREKHKVLLVWFGIALLLIFIAIPWPFSPLAQRPFIR